MLWYHLKLSVLRLFKNRVFSVTNILGLSIGIACFFVLFIHVQNERSYDRHISGHENIYRVISTPNHINDEWKDAWARSLGFIKEASLNFPEVENATKFSHSKLETLIINNQSVLQQDILSVDTNFMSIFGIESLVGNLEEIVKPNVAFISERFAMKYFKNENPIGQYIETETLRSREGFGRFEIVGIIKNTPIKTHFNCEILLSQKGVLEGRYNRLSERKTHWVYNYVKLKNEAEHTNVADKLLSHYNRSSFKEKPGPREYNFRLLKITDIHLRSNHRFELKESSIKLNIKLFITIAFVILLVSLINFVSLITVNLFKRSKEFGMKSSVGAHRKHLLTQVLIEVLLLSFISIFISLFSIELIKPIINQFFEIQFEVYYSEPIIYFAILLVLVFSGGISVLFVRFFILKNNSTSDIIRGLSPFTGRRLLQPLMIFQILIVIVLISSTILVNKQIHYILDQPLGFIKDKIVVLQVKDFSKDPNVFANELRKRTQIESVGFTRQYFGHPTQTLPLEGLGVEGTAEMSMANYDFLKTMDIQFVHNYINPSMDTIRGMVINRYLYNRLMEKHESIEQLKTYLTSKPLEENQIRFNIIGVVENFNYSSAHEQIGDYIFVLGECQTWARYTHIRLSSADIRTSMDCIQEEWSKHYPNQKMDYFFLDDKIAQQYKSENILRKILMSFSILGIIIGIIGIGALSYFTTEQRTKEIGVRRVNGAKTYQVIKLLNSDFLKLVAIAFVIACPIAWYAMYKWLENFAYKTELSWWIFALAGLIAMGIALITVSFQSWRAATRNPVESLRYE
ncbi:ABC transporter permease [Ancylomarina sp.]|uniref:ABC transporter permease n=1 Tax=Ancylomarina sp. TaxID=1970196 RepID=UPI003564C9FE